MFTHRLMFIHCSLCMWLVCDSCLTGTYKPSDFTRHAVRLALGGREA